MPFPPARARGRTHTHTHTLSLSLLHTDSLSLSFCVFHMDLLCVEQHPWASPGAGSWAPLLVPCSTEQGNAHPSSTHPHHPLPQPSATLNPEQTPLSPLPFLSLLPWPPSLVAVSLSVFLLASVVLMCVCVDVCVCVCVDVCTGNRRRHRVSAGVRHVMCQHVRQWQEFHPAHRAELQPRSQSLSHHTTDIQCGDHHTLTPSCSCCVNIDVCFLCLSVCSHI